MNRQAYMKGDVLGASCEAVTFYSTETNTYMRVTFRTPLLQEADVPQASCIVETLGFDADALGNRPWKPVEEGKRANAIAVALYLLPELREKHKASVTPVE